MANLNSHLEEQYGSKPPTKKRTRIDIDNDPFADYEQLESNLRVAVLNSPPVSLSTQPTTFPSQLLFDLPTVSVPTSTSDVSTLKLSGETLIENGFTNPSFFDIEANPFLSPSAVTELNLLPFSDGDANGYISLEKDTETLFSSDSGMVGNTANKFNSSNFASKQQSTTQANNTKSESIKDINNSNSVDNNFKEKQQKEDMSDLTSKDHNKHDQIPPSTIHDPKTEKASTVTSDQESQPLSTVYSLHPLTENISGSILLEQKQKLLIAKVRNISQLFHIL
jgi:hypothetical protein